MQLYIDSCIVARNPKRMFAHLQLSKCFFISWSASKFRHASLDHGRYPISRSIRDPILMYAVDFRRIYL